MVSVTARKIREHQHRLVVGMGSGQAGGPDAGLASSLVSSSSPQNNGNGNGNGNGTRVYTGFLISYPVVGRGMVIFRDPHGHRMITTPVRRVLGEPGVETLYVETENSVYRLTFHGAPIAPMLNPAGEAAL